MIRLRYLCVVTDETLKAKQENEFLGQPLSRAIEAVGSKTSRRTGS